MNNRKLYDKINIYLFYSFKGNSDGVVTVFFTEIEQADACCQYMNGRIWHGRVIECKTWDGKKFSFFKLRQRENQ